MTLIPLHVFRFDIAFKEAPLSSETAGAEVVLCDGAFSEISGLEATIEPFEIREGGNNYGTRQRVGRVTFSTIVLKRGMTTNRHLWHWFYSVASGAYAHRLNATITLKDVDGEPALRWEITRCMPVKLVSAALSASDNSIGIEELHLAHEGLREVPVTGGAS